MAKFEITSPDGRRFEITAPDGATLEDAITYAQQKFGVNQEAKQERTALNVAQDVGITALKGAVGLPEAVVGLADIPTGGRVGKALDDIGVKFGDTQKALDSYYSAPQQEANRKVRDTQGFLPTMAAALENPSTIATTIGESIPQMIGGAGLARLGMKGVTALGGKVAPWLAGAVGEGTMAAGSAAEGMRQESPDQLLTGKQSVAAIGSGIGTAAFGAAGGKLAQKFKFGDMDTILAQGGPDALAAGAAKKGFLRQMTEGGISEGVFEELPQSIQETMWQNWATDKPLLEGTGHAGAMGMLAGLGMGAGGGGYNAAVSRIAPDSSGAVPADDILTQPAPPAFDAPVAPKPTAAEQALADIKPITALDRVAALDTEGEALLQRKNELAQPDYGPMFDAERAEVESKLAGLMEEREAITKTWPKAIEGTETNFTTEAGARLNARYALMEAGDLTSSHDENLRPSPVYPSEMQPRQRDRAASEMQISGIVQKLDPARLGESPDAATGAPIVGADGLVESGNARTIALKRVYQANGAKADAYRQFLKDNAARFGLTLEQVETMQRPVLVRVRATPVDRAEFARQANASTVAQMSPSEQARADSARIDSLDDLNPDEAGDFTSGSSRGFVRRFMASLPGTEQAGMIDATGQLSQSGYIRMRNAILAKAYGDSPVLLRMVESLDNNLRGISNALMRAAPAVAKSRQAIAEGAMFDADITPDLMSAVEGLSRLKDEGRSVADALAQSGMFGEQYSPETRELLQYLAENIRKPRKIADFIQAYFEALAAAGHPAQTSLLGDTRAPGKGELLTAARGESDVQDDPDGGTKLSRRQKPGAQDRRQPGDEARNQGGAQGDEGEKGAVTDQRQDGETDKQFAKRVVDKRMAPASLPERHGDYFLMEGATVVPVANLISTKSDAENQQGGDNGPKRMAAAARGELGKRAPITVMPSARNDGKYEVVDGNGTLTSVKKYGWKNLPVQVVSRDQGIAMIEADKLKDRLKGNFKPPSLESVIGKALANKVLEKVEYWKPRLPKAKISDADRAKAEKMLGPVIDAAKKDEAWFDERVKKTAAAFGGRFLLGPTKNIERAAVKLVEESFDLGEMKDIVRATIVVDSYRQAQAAIETIAGEFKIRQINNKSSEDIQPVAGARIKNKGPTQEGYQDVTAFVYLPGGGTAEIQINTPEVLSAKESGHVLYEGSRVVKDDPARQAEYIALRDAQVELYSAADLANRRKSASEYDPTREPTGSASRGLSSPDSSSSLNTLPSGNLTQEPELRSSRNSVRGGNFSGTFIGSPSDETVPQGRSKPYTGSNEGGQDVNAKSRKSSTQGQVPDAVSPAGGEQGTGRVRDDQGGGNRLGNSVDDAGTAPQGEVGQTRAGGVRGTDTGERRAEPGDRAGRDAGVPDGRLTPDEKLREGLAEFGAVLRQYYAKMGGVRMLTPEESAKLMPALIKILEALYEKGTKAAKALIAQAQAKLKKHDDEFIRTHWNKITPADYAAAAQQAIENIESRDQQGDLFAAKPQKQGGFDFNAQPEKSPEATKPATSTETPAGQPAAITKPKKAPPAGRDIPPKTGRNFVFGDNDLTYEGSWVQKATQNVEAVEMLKKLEADGRQATREEQAVLAKFIGWGASEIANTLFGDKLDGAAQALLDYDEAIANLGDKPYLTNARYGEYRPAFSVLHYRNPDLNWYTVGNITREMLDKARPAPATRKWLELRDRLQAVMTDQEWAEASRSTQYAHYTSKPVVKAMWRGMERMGFKGGYVLEPGAGIGVFPGLMPQAMAHNSSYTGIEFDSITGGILKQLFPDERILVESFVDTKLPPNFFTVAAGNPPFGQTPILADPKYRKLGFALHDYFFAKTIDSVQPGGLVMFVTSRYTMDKLNDKARAWMSERADLVGAIRLPQTAFQKNAGTEVVTDVLFLRKKVPGETFEHGQAWAKSVPITVNGTQYNINEYFAAHPEMVLGKHSDAGSMYGDKEYTVEPLDGDIEAQFDKAVDNLPEDILHVERGSAAEAAAVREIDFNPKAQKEGNYYVTDAGVLMQRENGVGVRVEKKSEKDIALLKDFVGLRDALKQAHYDQLNDGDWEKSLAALQKAYRAFVAKHGRINQFKFNVRKVEAVDEETGETYQDEIRTKRLPLLEKLYDDPEYSRVMGLEDINDDTGEITESQFLTDRVLGKPAKPEIRTTQDALLSVLNDVGKVDLAMIAGRLGGMDEADVVNALGTAIYQDPSEGWVMADEYLSGNVKEKLDQAIAAARSDRRYERNVEALREVQPTPKTSADIVPQLGMFWIPPTIYEQFLKEKTGVKAKVTYNKAARMWTVEAIEGRFGTQSTVDWGTPHRAAHEILDHAMNGNPVQITTKDPVNGGTVVLKDAMEAANQKIEQMKQAFSDWLWTDATRANELVKLYNDKFNTIAPRKFDGKHLDLPGASDAWRKKVHQHVKRGVWRIIQSGNTYLAHAVGSGKTAQMVMSAMEQKRLGLIKKPMIVVPNHMLQQMNKEWLEIYPAAKLMVADEKNFHTENRRRWASRVALSDVDGVIITHSAFKLLDIDPEFQKVLINRELEYLRAAYVDAGGDLNKLQVTVELDKKGKDKIKVKGSGQKSPTIKQLERLIEAMEQRLRAAMSSEGKDTNVRFDELGVDMLYVDEAHEYRKLQFATKRSVYGIDPVGSQQAYDLWIKTRWLKEKNPKRYLVMASGTPVTNTMAELYSVQKMMDYDTLEAMGLEDFDSWAAQFGTESTSLEQTASGGYAPVTRFNKFVNVNELTQMFRQFADVLTSDHLAAMLGDKRPKAVGGGRQMTLSPKLDLYTAFLKQELEPRMVATKNWKKTPEQEYNPDPVINIMTDAKLAAIDMRFMEKTLPSDPDSKLNRMIDGVIRVYKETGDIEYNGNDGKPETIKGAAQMVFFEQGFGKGITQTRGFDARAWFQKRMRDAGIPPAQVAFMSDYKKSDDKLKLFKDVNAGRVRILVGSSKNMGTGVNAQQRLIAMHHLDAPLIPALLEQREGRILRQGNKNKNVQIYAHAMKGSYDEQGWAILARKQFFIDQALSGDANLREIEDVSEVSHLQQASAMLADDPRLMEAAGLKADIEKLERLYRAHEESRARMYQSYNLAGELIRTSEPRLAEVEKQAARVQDLAGDKFKAKADGQTFDKRKEWGESIIRQARALVAKFQEGKVEIGSISGFPVVFRGEVRRGPTDGAVEYRMSITLQDVPEGAVPLAYDVGESVDPVGLSMRATNALADVARAPEKMRNAINEARSRQDALAGRLDAPFQFAQTLADKRTELMNLEEAIKTTAGAQQTWTLANTATGATVKGVAAENERAAKLKMIPWRKFSDAALDQWQATPETPTEATPMLSRGAAGPGISIDTLTAVRDRVAARMKNLPTVHVFASPDAEGVPGNLRAFIYQQGAQNDVEGALHQGEIYLFASGLRDALRAEQVLAEHEVTHYGLLGLLGKEGKRRVLQNIWARNARIRKQATAKSKANRINYLDATEEILADMDAKELTSLSGWRGFVLALRDWFASHGFDNIARWMNAALEGTLSDQARADLFAADLVRRARAFVENGPPMSGGLSSATALSQLRNLADDLPAQEKWLNAEARMRGFKDIEDLAARDYKVFENLAKLWREKHPADVMMSRGLQSEYEVQPDTAINHPIDGARLKALRRAAARVESPERGITFRVDEEGRAIVTGPARTKVPDRFQRFANDNGLTLVVRRGPVDGITTNRGESRNKFIYGTGQSSFGASMPIEYRESGALYFGEINQQGIDRTGKTRFSRANQSDAAQRADAILADSTAKWRPLDAITKAGVKLVHLDRATKALYAKAGKLLDALTPEKVKAGMVADYVVPGAVLDQRAMMQGRKRVQLRKTEQLIDKLANLTRAESRVAYEWMNNDNHQAADYLEAQLPPESVAVLKDVREMIDKLSQEAVRLGQLDAETYKKHRYAYLRRSYAKHMEEMPGREKVKRQRAIAILGDQYKGRGMVLDVAMKSIQNVAPEWWQRKLQAGKADKGLKGEQFIRLERRAHTGEGTTPMAGIGDRSPGRLLEVAYWPAGEAIPTKFKDWERNGTWQVRDTQGDKLVLWRDFTKQERETMGEVDEARFAIARTLHGMIQDIETGRYLNWLADNHAVIDPSRVTGPVVEASERMRDAFAPEEWVKVPDTKIPGTNVMKYGKLAGRYLPGPIWNDVRQTVGFRFQPLGETYAALHSAWKTSKTALSPAVHMNNVMANFVMADWHDVGAGHILKALRILLAASERDGKGIIGRAGNVASRAGISDREAAREILNRYQDSGGGIGTWITQEIQKEQMLPLIEALENELGLTGQNTANQIGVMAAVQKLMRLKFGEAWDAFKGSTPGGKVVQEARNLIGMYEAEDQVFRLAAWLKAKEDGINDLEAGKVARKSFLDYHINAPWVQMMRNTAFPFIAFTYRSVPMLLDVAANKPWKLMKLGLVLGALNAIGYALSGGDEDDERKLLPEEKSGSIWGIVPKLIRMPWNDAHGSPVFLDIRRFVPVGDIFDVGQPNTAVPVPPAVVPSGPLALLGELALNKSAFTGKPVTQETDTGTEKAGKVFDHLYKALAPNIAFLPGTHAWTSVTSAGGGKTDPFGREQSMAQAMASSVGFKLGSYPKDVLQYNAKRAAQAKVMEIDANINKLRREFARQGISEAEYQEKAQAQMEKKRRVMEELAEKAR